MSWGDRTLAEPGGPFDVQRLVQREIRKRVRPLGSQRISRG
jgi:hypothetical protein